MKAFGSIWGLFGDSYSTRIQYELAIWLYRGLFGDSCSTRIQFELAVWVAFGWFLFDYLGGISEFFGAVQSEELVNTEAWSPENTAEFT